MGKIPLLTKEQKFILDQVKQNEFLTSRFYFTGGTALSAYYLQHRESEDLDFFSQERFENQAILNLMEQWRKKHNFRFKSNFNEVVYIFNLTFKDGARLKVDFGYYPYKLLDKSNIKEDIRVDSLLDIAVNKLQTIHQRSNVKDFVDLYFLLKKFTIWDLIEGMRHKFNQESDPFSIAVEFMGVDEFKSLPRMFKKLTLDELKSFFISKAKKLGKATVKE